MSHILIIPQNYFKKIVVGFFLYRIMDDRTGFRQRWNETELEEVVFQLNSMKVKVKKLESATESETDDEIMI